MSDPNEAAIKRVLDLCEFWDGLTKTESPTTKQIREALGPEAIERANNPLVECCPLPMVAGCDHDR